MGAMLSGVHILLVTSCRYLGIVTWFQVSKIPYYFIPMLNKPNYCIPHAMMMLPFTVFVYIAE